MDISIIKKDETKIQVVSSDSGILQEISEHFTFMVDGAKFSPAYKSKRWDGKIRIYNLRDKSLPYGLLGELIDFCRSRDYTFDIDKKITDTYCPSIDELKKYVDSIPLSTRGQKIQLRDYQFDGVANAIRNQRSLTISPTASGKSAMIYMMCRWFLDNCDEDQKILLVVPSTSLVCQITKDFADYSEFDEYFNVEDTCSMIMSGYDKNPKKSKTKVTLEDNSIKYFYPNDIVNTKSGKIKAKYLTSEHYLI